MQGTSRPAAVMHSSPGNCDDSLARQARDDPQAFAELFQRHAQPVYRFHLMRTGNADDAQDLTSQTFLAAWENIDRYQGQGQFRAWLFGIANHKALDHFRRRRPDVPLDQALTLADPDPSPESLVADRLRLDQIARALDVLTPDQVQALTLRVFAGLSAAQVGQIMKKSETSVRMLVYRGLRRLRQQLSVMPEVSL